MEAVLDSARFFEDNIVSNHVLTDKIFLDLTKTELLECSLISKKWTSPCRQFLRSHHECLLRLDARTLESVLDTSKLLDDSNQFLYNGISLNISNIFTGDHRILEELPEILKVVKSIFKRLPKVKFLTLNAEGSYNFWNFYASSVPKHCQIDLHGIEKLEIIRSITPVVWNAFFGQGEFLSLKVAILHGEYFYYGYTGFDEILPRFLSSCPVLQEWSSVVRQSHIKYFAQSNKLAVLKTIMIHDGIHPDDVDRIESGKVALRRIYSLLEPKAENVEIFRRITAASTASLQKHALSYRFCKMLIITPGIHPFINLKVLSFPNEDYPGSFEVKAEMEANSNVQRLFPNAKVLCGLSSDWMK